MINKKRSLYLGILTLIIMSAASAKVTYSVSGTTHTINNSNIAVSINTASGQGKPTLWNYNGTWQPLMRWNVQYLNSSWYYTSGGVSTISVLKNTEEEVKILWTTAYGIGYNITLKDNEQVFHMENTTNVNAQFGNYETVHIELPTGETGSWYSHFNDPITNAADINNEDGPRILPINQSGGTRVIHVNKTNYINLFNPTINQSFFIGWSKDSQTYAGFRIQADTTKLYLFWSDLSNDDNTDWVFGSLPKLDVTTQTGNTAANYSWNNWTYYSNVPNDVVRFWDFNEGFGTTADDESSNDKDLTGTSTPQWIKGKYSWATDLDGTEDYWSSTDLTALEDDTEGTISLWFYMKDVSIAADVIFSLGRNTDATDVYLMIYHHSNGNFYTNLYGGGEVKWSQTMSIPSYQQWHHIAIVQTGSNLIKIYLDNVNTYNITGGNDVNAWMKYLITDAPDNAEVITIGGWLDGGSLTYPFNGYVDQVRIYSRALSGEEVGRLFGFGLPDTLSSYSATYGGVTQTESFNEEFVNVSYRKSSVSRSYNEDTCTYTDTYTYINKTNDFITWTGTEGIKYFASAMSGATVSSPSMEYTIEDIYSGHQATLSSSIIETVTYVTWGCGTLAIGGPSNITYGYDVNGSYTITGAGSYTCKNYLNLTEISEDIPTSGVEEAVEINNEAWGSNNYKVNCTWTASGYTHWTSENVNYNLIPYNISAKSSVNNAIIRAFNVTIDNGAIVTNDTKYNATAGNLSYNRYINITIRGAGIEDYSATNVDTNQNNQYTVTPRPITMGPFNISYPTNTLTGQNVTMTGSYSESTGMTITKAYNISNQNETVNQNRTQTNNQYTILGTDFQDELEFKYVVCNLYNCNQSETKTIEDGEINAMLNISILNYLGELISNVRVDTWLTGSDNTSPIADDFAMNPFTHELTNYGNGTDARNKTIGITFNITDYTYKNINGEYNLTVSESNLSQSITLTAKQFVLTFSEITTGYLMMSDTGGFWFNDTQIVYVTQNLSLGEIKAFFGSQVEGNWTQYYEFVNDGTSRIDQDVQIINTTDETRTWIYLRALDIGNSPIKNAVIRAFRLNLNTSLPADEIQNYDFIGQRLTDDNGYTVFYLNKDELIRFVVSKEDYTVETILLNPLDESSLTESTARVVYLKESRVIENGVGVECADFVNRSLRLGCRIYAPDANLVEIITSYAEGQDKSWNVLSGDDLGIYDFNLTSGWHWTTATNDSLLLMIKIDGVNTRNVTINYITPKSYDIIDLSGIDRDTVNVGVFILMILLGVIAGSLFKNTDAGVNVFLIGMIFASLITVDFWLISLLSLLAFIMKNYQGGTD